MPSEKQNEYNRLAEKLAGLNQLSGEAPLDKGALWEKLHQRMDVPARRSSRYFWYWAAAACILLMTGVGYFFTPAPALHRTATRPQQPTALPGQHNQTIQMPVATATPPVQKKQPAKAVYVVKKQQPAGIAPEPIISHSPQTLPPLETAVAQAVVATPEAPFILAEASPAPKRKVVHLNEIAEPTVPSGKTMHQHITRHTRQDYKSGVSFSKNASDEIIKINLSAN